MCQFDNFRFHAFFHFICLYLKYSVTNFWDRHLCRKGKYPLVRNLWFRYISRIEVSQNREQHRRSHFYTGRWNCLYRSALLALLRDLCRIRRVIFFQFLFSISFFDFWRILPVLIIWHVCSCYSSSVNSIISSTVQSSFLQIFSIVSIDTYWFFPILARMFPLIPVRYCISIRFIFLSMSIFHNLL